MKHLYEPNASPVKDIGIESIIINKILLRNIVSKATEEITWMVFLQGVPKNCMIRYLDMSEFLIP